METPKALCGHPLYWRGLYKKDYDLAMPESNAHPAKMGWDLCFKILAHLQELGLMTGDSVVLDPMAGTGRTNLCAAAMGIRTISVELEPKFIGFQLRNHEYLGRKLGHWTDWTIIQGDARKLSELLTENGLVSVMSPPYADSDNRGRMDKTTAGWSNDGRHRGGAINRQDYGQAPGQIGSLPDKPLVTVTSPPYEDSDVDGARKMPEHYFDMVGGVRHRRTIPYGTSEGQIGREREETYLSAMSEVYAEIAKVSDVLVVVVKNPTRNGQLRRLDRDTMRILRATGWRLRDYHRALLFEELEQGDMLNGSTKVVFGRMSFFKRLSWRKGHPVAAWEDVFFLERNRQGSLMNKYREALESMVFQFGFRGVKDGKPMIWHGGMSALEQAFETLRWHDVHFLPEEGYTCEVEGCMEADTCGTHWGDSKLYLRLCSEHYAQSHKGFPMPVIKQWALDREAKRDPITRILPTAREV